MGVGGTDNYRDLIYPVETNETGKSIRGYKFTRRNRPQTNISKTVSKLKKLAIFHELAVACNGREADDYVRIWAEECRYFDIPFAIASVDKDLKCIPGTHIHLKDLSVEKVSELDAMNLYYGQLITGDSTDCIPGLRLHGPVKAAKLLEHCRTEESFQEAVIGAYFNVHGDSWAEYLLANGKLLHIQRHINDWFCFDEWPMAREYYG